MVKLYTNGAYQPTLHRVVNTHPERSRVSLAFFFEPEFDALVAPLPQLCGSEEPRYAPVVYGAHLESKVLTNFEGLEALEAEGAAVAAASAA